MEEVLGPERLGGQGLDCHQEESGNHVILALLQDPEVRDHVDLVITYRDGAYEVWAARGMVRFQRVLRNGQLSFPVVEQIGENPIADQRHDTIVTCADELHAAAASGHATRDVNQAFIEPEHISYPYGYERIAQLFDSPHAPEAFHRVLGPHAFTANIHEPQGRGADHAALEGRVVGPRDRLKALTPSLVEAISPRYAADGKEAVYREALLDARGMAQLMVLLDDPSHPSPVLVAHEFALTDGAGHDYGPHSDGVRAAIAETDRRLGQVLDLLQSKSLCDSTLFIFTSDHGMAPQNVALRANAARHPERIGIKTVTGEPMIWLRDLNVTVEAAPDGRTARVTVLDNDPDYSGERPPIAGAEILVQACPDAASGGGHKGDLGRAVAKLISNESGIAGFATPADIAPAHIVVSVHHPEYNPRHLRLDGRNLCVDLRRALYGSAT